jgi:hypothetical protein
MLPLSGYTRGLSVKPPTLKPTRFLKPRGYTGRRHEVLGSDILAHLRVLRQAEKFLGADADALRELDRSDWYPVEVLLRVEEALEESLGKFGLSRAGRTLFEMSHKDRMLELAHSARDVIYGMDALYHFSNRGIGIGGWRVVSFGIGRAELEKTTPQHCLVEEGVLTGALSAVGCPSSITQSKCVRQGYDHCLFSVTSAFIDARWTG